MTKIENDEKRKAKNKMRRNMKMKYHVCACFPRGVGTKKNKKTEKSVQANAPAAPSAIGLLQTPSTPSENTNKRAPTRSNTQLSQTPHSPVRELTMKIICGLAACVATLSPPGGAFLFPSALPPRRLVGNTAMLKSACSSSLGAGAGGAIAPVACRRRRSGSSSSSSILRAGAEKEPEVTVFDAEGGVSWEDYKKQKPDEYKLDKTDEMQCWETDECPVEDEQKFTKAWHIHSAEKNPTTETHFDSEGEWEEEIKGAWSKKWYEDVGADDLHEEGGATESQSGSNI